MDDPPARNPDGNRLAHRGNARDRGVDGRSSETHIWEQVLDAMAANPTVDFAYPTTRRFDNMNEGKPGVRAVLGARAVPSTTRD